MSGSVNDPAIGGTCAPGFERVREAFAGNFAAGGEVGAAVAVWVEGDLVVNLWGGHTDAHRQRQQSRRTIVVERPVLRFHAQLARLGERAVEWSDGVDRRAAVDTLVPAGGSLLHKICFGFVFNSNF